jgi:hypothetical protein
MPVLHVFAVSIALVVCRVHADPALPGACEVRRLAYEGSLHECAALGWTRVAAPWMSARPWLALKRATCEAGVDA